MKKVLSALIALSILFVFSFFVDWNYEVRGEPKSGVKIDQDDIGGKVKVNKGGSAAGVWVIAETEDLPTKFRKIVVTNDKGDFVIPDLPNATYDVWVRGYGLVDSEPVQVSLGKIVQLHADLAGTPQEAAEIYPANYWYSLLELPDESLFPGTGTGPGQNGIPTAFVHQASWVNRIKLSCELCHQMGTERTRDLTTPQQWDGAMQLAGSMNSAFTGLGREKAKQVFSDWGARIEAGEVPPQPPRPQGIERNFVITQWVWGDQFAYVHDEIATDKRNPELYPNGMVWGVDLGMDRLLAVDPITNEAFEWHVPTVGGYSTPWCQNTFKPLGGTTTSPSGFCTWNVYTNAANPHNPMMDDKGRVWMTTQIRREWAEDMPDFCLDDPFVASRSHHRQLGYFDTETEEIVLIDTCFSTHHLQFDSDDVLWFSNDPALLGRFDTNIFDALFDPDTWDNENDSQGAAVEAAQSWFVQRVDSDGDPATPLVDKFGSYGVMANVVDGTVWRASPGYPGFISRFDPETEMFEAYNAPAPLGHGPRGIDFDTEGNVWVFLGGSSHIAKFDRSQCAQTWGTGDQCPEGWTLWEIPGPDFKDIVAEGTRRSDFQYFGWVDQFNTLGLGENTVIANGTGSDSLIAFNPETEEFTTIHMPYPLGFFQRLLDGRIDNPSAGWKGRGLWVDYGGDPIKHTETQIGQLCKVQLRNDPLDH